MKPKQCVNSKCKNTFFIQNHKLHLPLQCENCVNKNK
jgi:hypothetical protein